MKLRNLLAALLLSVPAFAQTYVTRTALMDAGAYSSSVTYAQGDVVTSGGKYYESLISQNVGHDPATTTNDWGVITGSGSGGTGTTGATGPQGPAGTAATVSVGTTTSGSTAAVTNSGTPSAAILNFVLPTSGGSVPGITNDGTYINFALPTRFTSQTSNSSDTWVTGSSGDSTCPSTVPSGGFVECVKGGIKQISYSSGVYLPEVIADIQITMPTSSLAGNSCTATATATMTGLATTSSISSTFSSDPSSVTGWGSTGGLMLATWPSAANTLSWRVCNQTGSSITPGAMTMNVGAR